ncbi:substrate-binding periplasmic protein [Chitinimonas sp. BJB300]|uniref:substrate-binding periplasmic protein n=1 Tax=Chitinimonas sp. BJB300 TaxID=1559339 RepID=UPI0013042921|nr:transporter substrate-binding domain-containing protein [Chitinimonas sp. BJB300]
MLVRLLLSSLLLISLPVVAAPWLVASDEAFPPYAYIDPITKQPAGMDTEIVRAIMDTMEQPYEIKLYPWERVKKMLEFKQVDMAYQFAGTPERAAQYHLVGPIRHGITILMARRDSAISYQSLEDLMPYTVGTVFGYSYTEAFDKAPLKKDSGATNPQQLMQKLIAHRVDVVIGDKAQLLYLARELGVERDVRTVGKPLAEVPRYVGFPKDEQAKASLFAEGLEKSRRDGTLEKILNKWQ